MIKEMLKASEGQTKVIKVMKYLHKCPGDNMFSAEEEKKPTLNGSGLSEGTDWVSQLREQQEVWPQPERGASPEYNHGRCDIYHGYSITETHMDTKAYIFVTDGILDIKVCWNIRAKAWKQELKI